MYKYWIFVWLFALPVIAVEKVRVKVVTDNVLYKTESGTLAQLKAHMITSTDTYIEVPSKGIFAGEFLHSRRGKVPDIIRAGPYKGPVYRPIEVEEDREARNKRESGSTVRDSEAKAVCQVAKSTLLVSANYSFPILGDFCPLHRKTILTTEVENLTGEKSVFTFPGAFINAGELSPGHYLARVYANHEILHQMLVLIEDTETYFNKQNSVFEPQKEIENDEQFIEWLLSENYILQAFDLLRSVELESSNTDARDGAKFLDLKAKVKDALREPTRGKSIKVFD